MGTSGAPRPGPAPAAGPLHLSVDDVVACLRDLGDGRHATPWTQPTFAYLRELHARAGVVVSLYPFLSSDGWALEDVPTRHRSAFAAASGWLRFGFHALDAATAYGVGGVSADAARDHYARFAAAVLRFAGPASLDRLPRVHRFQGRLDVVRAWRDATAGVVGLLTADDDRAEVYHLDTGLRARVAADGVAYDGAERLHLVASLPRLEHEPDVVARLEATAGRGDRPRCLFTHEPDLASAAVRARVEEAVAWGAGAGVGWGFPQDVLAPPAAASAAAS